MSFIANIPRELLIQGAAHTTSKGNQTKWVTKNGQVFVKECFENKGRKWRDDLVEVIASQYSNLCNTDLVPVVEQSLCTVEDRPASASANFLRPDEVFVSFYKLKEQSSMTYKAYYSRGARDNFEYLRDCYLETTGIDVTDYLLGMATLDTIVGNEDRHFNNFGVIFNTKTGLYRLCPLFDFGLGMFGFSADYDGMPYNKCRAKVDGHPFASKSDKVVDWLVRDHRDFLERYLPKSVTISDFEFPSKEGKFLFIDRNKAYGVEVVM